MALARVVVPVMLSLFALSMTVVWRTYSTGRFASRDMLIPAAPTAPVVAADGYQAHPAAASTSALAISVGCAPIPPQATFIDRHCGEAERETTLRFTKAPSTACLGPARYACTRRRAKDSSACAAMCISEPNCSHAVEFVGHGSEVDCFLKQGPVLVRHQRCTEKGMASVFVRAGAGWTVEGRQPACERRGSGDGAPAKQPEPFETPPPDQLPPIGYETQPPPLAPYIARGGPQCVVLVDRHVHKNGGSTLRDLFMRNEQAGTCLYWGYTLYSWQWRPVMAALRAYLAEAHAQGRAAPKLRLCAEAHYPAGGFNMSDLLELRSQMEALGPGSAPRPALASLPAPAAAAAAAPLSVGAAPQPSCRVVLTTRLRDPFAFYLSFYRWAGIAAKQAKDPEAWGRNFIDWVPPNLQTALLHAPHFADFAENIPTNQRAEKFALINGTVYGRVRAMLRQFDLVGTLERFDASLLLLSDLSGLPQLLYQRREPQKNAKGIPFDRAKRRAAALRNNQSVPEPTPPSAECPDMDACLAHVRRVARYDFQLYGEFSAAFDARLAAAGPGFARRLEQLRAAQREVQEGVTPLPDVEQHCKAAKYVSRMLTKPEKEAYKCAPGNPPQDTPAGFSLCRSVHSLRSPVCVWQTPHGFPPREEANRRLKLAAEQAEKYKAWRKRRALKKQQEREKARLEAEGGNATSASADGEGRRQLSADGNATSA